MLNVKFPSIGEYNYDRSEKLPPMNEDDLILHDDEFWAPYDPFESYDAFGPYESCESYEKWRQEFYKDNIKNANKLPTKDTAIVPLNDNLPPALPMPKMLPSKDPAEEGFHVIYHQVIVLIRKAKTCIQDTNISISFVFS